MNVRLSVAILKFDRMASPRRTELKPSHQWVASRSAKGVGSIPLPLRTKSASPVNLLAAAAHSNGRLTAVELNRGARNAPMAPNGIKHDEQVEIDFIIHNGNI